MGYPFPGHPAVYEQQASPSRLSEHVQKIWRRVLLPNGQQPHCLSRVHEADEGVLQQE